MAEGSNTQIVRRIEERLKEKDDVIREQQKQIHDLENNVQDLEGKLVEAEEKLAAMGGAAEEREELVRKLNDLLG